MQCQKKITPELYKKMYFNFVKNIHKKIIKVNTFFSDPRLGMLGVLIYIRFKAERDNSKP